MPNTYKEFFIEESFPSKEKIIEQNRRYSWVYIVKEGITKCYISDENGKDFIQEFLGIGMEFGELEVFSGNPAFCSIEGLTSITTLKISHSNFNKLLEEDIKFNRFIIEAMAIKIGYKAPRHSYQHGYSIEDNILRLQEQFPEFIKVIPKQDIANYLGITLRSFNRALKQIESKEN